MNKNNIKLGLFVISGFILMMAVFFYIGSGSGIFTSKFELRARFKNSNGLREGSNVLFSGMQAGSVKSVKLSGRDDIEVIMLIDKDIAKHIDNNAKASIGTEGIIGNAVVNILPYGKPGRPVQEKNISRQIPNRVWMKYSTRYRQATTIYRIYPNLLKTLCIKLTAARF